VCVCARSSAAAQVLPLCALPYTQPVRREFQNGVCAPINSITLHVCLNAVCARIVHTDTTKMQLCKMPVIAVLPRIDTAPLVSTLNRIK
jgi:hypothetical protein